MARRSHHYRRLRKEPPELNITTFLNLMVVLVPFLLITAVFSRITIMELSLPSGEGVNDNKQQQLSIEVIIRQKGIEIGNGKQVLARFPLLKEEDVDLVVDEDGNTDTSKLYDYKLLSEFLVKIKGKYPAKTDALVLMEPDIEYRVLIRAMDTLRSTFVRQPGEEGEADVLQQVVLFPDISIGDAP
ncbi:MAG: biopolymer transporter ExbD [Gammaproteobacteria bacterium]|nr:biopolymer transporter ExbD [Gammaproteobacteria bacterium]